MPDLFFNDRVVRLDCRGHPLVALLPLLTGHVAQRRHVRVEQHVLLLGTARDLVAEVARIC